MYSNVSSKYPMFLIKEPLQFHIVIHRVSQARHSHATLFSIIITLPSLQASHVPSFLVSSTHRMFIIIITLPFLYASDVPAFLVVYYLSCQKLAYLMHQYLLCDSSHLLVGFFFFRTPNSYMQCTSFLFGFFFECVLTSHSLCPNYLEKSIQNQDTNQDTMF